MKQQTTISAQEKSFWQAVAKLPEQEALRPVYDRHGLNGALREPGLAELQEKTSPAVSTGNFGHDFSQIPVSLGGACHTCPLPVQTKLSISEPGDEYEREADRIAEAVMQDAPLPHLPAKGKEPPHLRRVKNELPPTEEEKQEQTEEMLEKVAETFLDGTEIGKYLEEQIETWGEDFLATLHGLVFTGVTAAGTISILAANHSELPMQVPEITLMPGLTVKIEWEGPMDQPTDGSITFSYSPESPDVSKPGLSEKERHQARMVAKQNARLEAASRESQVTPEQRASGQDLADRQFAAEMAARRAPQFREGWAFLEQDQKKSKFQLTEPSFTSPYKGFEAPKIPGLELKLKPPGKLPKRKEETVQRKAENSSPPVRAVPPIVHEVLQSPGQPLDRETSNFMESRFGRDFTKVRVHEGSRAVESARLLNALAYTVGTDIVFGSRGYSTKTRNGLKLLAHELVHVLQQNREVSSIVKTDSVYIDNSSKREPYRASIELFSKNPFFPRKLSPRYLAKFDDIWLPGMDWTRPKPPSPPPLDPHAEYEMNLKVAVDLLRNAGFGRAARTEKFDKNLWEKVDDPGSRGRGKMLRLKNGVSPSLAINRMFQDLNAWSVDCAEFVQVAQWYALLHAYGPTQFDSNFKDPEFRLKPHASTGVKQNKLYKRWAADQIMTVEEGFAEETSDSTQVDELLKTAPIGSRVQWTNSDPAAVNTAWHHENTIKLGDDLFAAHGLTFPDNKNTGSEAEVKQALANEAMSGNTIADAAYINANLFLAQIELYLTP